MSSATGLHSGEFLGSCNPGRFGGSTAQLGARCCWGLFSRKAAIWLLLALASFGGPGELSAIQEKPDQQRLGSAGSDNQEPSESGEKEGAAKTDAGPIVQDGDAFRVTAEEVSAALTELAAQTSLDEPTRTSITQLLQAAQKKIENSAQLKARLADFEKRITEAAADRAAAEKRRDLLISSEPARPQDFPQLEQLRQVVTQTQSELGEAQKLLTTLKEEPARRLARASEIPALVSAIEQRIGETKSQLEVVPPETENPLLTAARRLQLRAMGLELASELESLNRELLYYSGTADLLVLQQEVAQQQVNLTSRGLEQLQEGLIRRQETRLQRLSRDASDDVRQVPLGLRWFAEETASLARAMLAHNDRANTAARELKDVSALRTDVEQQQQTALDRFRSVGLTDALGGMLRKQRRDLALLQRTTKPSAQAQQEIRDLQVSIFQLQDQAAEFPDDKALVESLLRDPPPVSATDGSPRSGSEGRLPTEEPTPAVDDETLRPVAERLVTRRREVVNELSLAADQKFRNLVSLDTEKRQAVDRIALFLEWIDTRVIWIPSAPFFATGDLRVGLEAIRWLGDPVNWHQVGKELAGDFQNNLSTFLPFLLAVFVLFLVRSRLKRIISDAGAEASRSRCAAILPTINCMMATFLMASLWPMILAVLGWTLSHGPEAGSFVFAVGRGLIGVAVFVAPLELLRHVCRENGLAEMHFAWPDRTRRHLMTTLRSFFIFSLPLLLGQGILAAQLVEDWKNSLGRFFSCLLFGVAAWYLHRVFRPAGTVFQQMSAQRPIPNSWRFRGLIHLIAVSLPLSLLVLSLAGYYYTAFELGACLEHSLSLVIVMVIVGGLALRWLLVRRRALAMDEARKARLAQAVASESSTPGADLLAANAERALLDISSVSRQARELALLVIGTVTFLCLLAIWRDVLPAVGILDQYNLWSVTVSERVEFVTLKNALLAALTTAFTWLMIRNMPGLLNLVVQKMSLLDSGARYAAITVFRYIIMVIGAVIALSFLKIQWGQYGWLVAAVTVGLGFGLQEIVANFVSGLVLLFERPVRVGDLVTIENTNGVVTRIQMRATTVMTWDHQELIVPNKDLITGKLLNWTLSNHTNRLILSVGVGFDSDPDRVRDLLERTVRSFPEVLNDPPPTVNFELIGESALEFRVCCFLSSVEQRIWMRHQLNTAIVKAMKDAGVELPFPRRDLRILDHQAVARASDQFPVLSGQPGSPNRNS